MTTTPGAIRDRAIYLVEKTITPAVHSGQRFLAHREEADFRTWADKNPAACLRRFSIDFGGDTTQALVTDHQAERVEESLTVTVAYPTDFRHGSKQLAGLKDAIATDAVKIEATIGVPSSDATYKALATIFRTGEASRELSDSGAVTFLTIPYRIEYTRSLT